MNLIIPCLTVMSELQGKSTPINNKLYNNRDAHSLWNLMKDLLKILVI